MRNGGPYLNTRPLRVCTDLFEMQQILSQAFLREVVNVFVTYMLQLNQITVLEIELGFCLHNYAGL